MANMLENLGLGFLRDDEEVFTSILGYIVHEGKPFMGYSGVPYIYKDTGTSEFWVSLEVNEEEKNMVVSKIHTHGGNMSIMDFKHTGIDISPKDMQNDEHIGFLSLADGSAGMIPIDIINADVLPSFMHNDDIQLQLIAYPLEINYYKNEEEYSKTLPKDKHGKTWGVAMGSLMALSFLANHNKKTYDENKEYKSDKYVHFTAKVKELYRGTFGLGEDEKISYIRCVADTNYGEIEFDHAIDFVQEEQLDNIRVGAIIDGVCIISGDAAIGEYQDGAVFDLEHDLRLLRYVMSEGKVNKLKGVVNDNTQYISYSYDKIFKGTEEVIGKFKTVYDNQQNSDTKHFAHMATITSVDDSGLEYPVGTKCLVLAYNEEDNYAAILFLDVDDDGRIENIKITNDSRYQFSIENPKGAEIDLDDLAMPESVVEAMMIRAKLIYNVLNDVDELNAEDFEREIDAADYHMFKHNAQMLLDDLKENKQEDIETALENSFGYLFAKTLEHEYNLRYNVSPDTNGRLLSSYCPEDAFIGVLESTLDESLHKKLEATMGYGKSFFKDFRNYLTMQGDDKGFEELYTKSAIVVQRLGQLYFDNFIKDS
ncbi:MAG: hypothetical protein PUC29_07060 [Clostridia bacterium]|nr:hypothetical protein [Clostridia bacterium]